MESLPRVFCWTKIGADASQSLQVILRRKDHERLYGAGEVWWGIGEMHRQPQIQALVQRVHPCNPLVVFTPDRKAQATLERAGKGKSFPKHRASLAAKNGAGVLVWRDYLHRGSQLPIPPHALVLSSATTKTSSPKLVYFALVCRCESSLTMVSGGQFYPCQYQNLTTRNQQFGQQVTVAVEQKALGVEGNGEPYPIFVRAELVGQRIVTLANPRPLNEAERKRTDEAGMSVLSRQEWMEFVHSIRRDE